MHAAYLILRERKVMDGLVATRLPKELGIMVRETTPFVIHSAFLHAKNNVIDFTEHRINRLILKETNYEVLTTLKMLLREYKSGALAIAWHHGAACSVPVTKER